MKYAMLAAVFMMAGSFTISTTAQAQDRVPVQLKSVGADASWYEPELDFYQESPNYFLDFGGHRLTGADVELALFELLTLRVGASYWAEDVVNQLNVTDASNARRHVGELRIVPISATLYYEAVPAEFLGIRPVLGLGVSQNLIERRFERERLNGETPIESFEGNGRTPSFHLMAGLHRHLAGPIWAGFEGKYVLGSFQEEVSGAEAADVSLDGFAYGVNFRYRFGD